MAKSTPIPKGYSALLILSSTCYILMGLIFNTLTPYILRYLLDDNQEKDSLVGIYSGWMNFSNQIIGVASSIFWQNIIRGWLYDTCGSRTTYNTMLLIMLFSTISYSLSQSILQAFLCYSFIGTTSGFLVVMKAHIFHVSDETNICPMLNYIIFSQAIATIFGPFISGFLTEPAKQFPTLFTHEFWQQFPFIIPAIILQLIIRGTMLILTLIITNIYIIHIQNNPAKQKIPLIAIITRNYVKLCLIYNMQNFTVYWNFTGFLLLVSTSKDQGGLGWNQLQLAICLSISGVLSLPYSNFILTQITKKYGERKAIQIVSYVVAFGSFLICFLVFFSDIILMIMTIIVYFLGIFLSTSSIVPMSILIGNTLYTEHQGIGQGFNYSVSCVSKSLGCLLSSLMFVWGLNNGMDFPFNHIIIFIIGGILTLATIWIFTGLFDKSIEKRKTGTIPLLKKRRKS